VVSPAGETPTSDELVAWREPPPALRARNLALAYANSGFEHQPAPQIARAWRLLKAVEKQFPDDPAVLTALATAFLSAKQPLDAAHRFERVLELGVGSAMDEANAGTAWLQAGQIDKATHHLERAVQSDPLLFPAVQALVQVYQYQGNMDKVSALAERVRAALASTAPQEPRSAAR
jgi:predicted Zn-dependent protease